MVFVGHWKPSFEVMSGLDFKAKVDHLSCLTHRRYPKFTTECICVYLFWLNMVAESLTHILFQQRESKQFVFRSCHGWMNDLMWFRLFVSRVTTVKTFCAERGPKIECQNFQGYPNTAKVPFHPAPPPLKWKVVIFSQDFGFTKWRFIPSPPPEAT